MSGVTKGFCECGNVQTSKGIINGKKYYSRYCQSCKENRIKYYNKNKKLVCSICGFQAQHPAQMDIDHIDGDHRNNDPENLQEICANCHRLKTIQNMDWLKQNGKEVINRTAHKWIGRYAREYLRSIGFKLSDSGRYSKEMLQALEKAGIEAGKRFSKARANKK